MLGCWRNRMRLPLITYFCLLSFPAAASLIPTNSVVLCGGSTTVCTTLLSQPTPINLSATTYTNGASSITISGTDSEDSTGMVMKSSAAYSGLTGSYYTQMNSVAGFSDTVTISSSLPGLAGTVGYLEMAYNVSGTNTPFVGAGQVTTILLDPAGSNNISPCFFFGNGTPPGGPAQAGCSFQNGVVTTGIGAMLPFHYGTTFTLSWSLAAVMFPVAGIATSGFSDYSHTATVQGLWIFTSQGTNLTGSNVSIQTSGETFAVLAPEPSTSAPVAAGFAVVVTLALFKRRRLFHGVK